ncbi:ATP-binding cassette domain-containing protein [Chitinimonas sp.]|uniref:ATP-binding cassette domain-containing protein n=1 Tax=Chitinimonas sp. TaxID=1934313 RepID=UPI0035AF7879
MLHFEQTSLIRDGKRVIDGLTVSAFPGYLTTILGPNGAGKSSLLALAAGEISPSSGRVLLHADALSGLPAARLARCRAMLPQQSTLEFDYTVGELVLLGANPFPDIPTREITQLANSVMQLLDAASLVERRYLALSGGEKQRVQLARVLVQACAAAALGPALLLLDEPIASLDPRHQHLLLAGLHQLCRNVPLAIVASLHDVNLALHYADQAWLLNQGKLIAAGPPRQALSVEALSTVFELPVRQLGDQLLFTSPLQ